MLSRSIWVSAPIFSPLSTKRTLESLVMAGANVLEATGVMCLATSAPDLASFSQLSTWVRSKVGLIMVSVLGSEFAGGDPDINLTSAAQ